MATRKAVAAANLKKKTDRLRRELGTLPRTESDRLLAQSSKLLQAIFLLEEIAERSGEVLTDRSAELAEELRSLLVEQAYQESIAEGTIVIRSKDGESVAWIS